MSTPSLVLFRRLGVGLACVVMTGATTVHAQAKKPNPASKLYISDVAGEAQIKTGDTVEDLTKRSVYTAEGVVIDTKRPESTGPGAQHYSTMVYSNGTGAYFDADTRVEIRRFVQEPFVPTRADNETEPSISQTQAFVARGTVGLCTSKLVAGSSMNYTTPHASVNIRGRKVVIQAEADTTRISMLEGESTVRAGTTDMGGHTVHAGEQAIIKPGLPGQPNSVQIVKISQRESDSLDDKVAMACMAKKTVYFDVRGRQQSNGNSGDATGGSSGGDGEVDAFNTATASSRVAGGPFTSASGEIVAIPLVPTSLPVQFTVSPAAIITPTGKVVPGNGGGAGGPPGR